MKTIDEKVYHEIIIEPNHKEAFKLDFIYSYERKQLAYKKNSKEEDATQKYTRALTRIKLI